MKALVFLGTRPTSAYPEHYSRPLLFGASYTVTAFGLVACSESTVTGFPVPSIHWDVTLGWHFTPGLVRVVATRGGTVQPETSSLLGLLISRLAGSASRRVNHAFTRRYP